MTVTLAELRQQSKRRSDMEKSNFVADSEWNEMINSSIAELHDILIAAYGEDYRIESDSFTTTAGTDSYDLPDNFYKLRGVDLRLSDGNFYTLKRFNFNERNRYTQDGLWEIYGLPFVRYRVVGNQVRFSPVPDKDLEIQLWYHPVSTKLVDDADEFDDINLYSEYVVVDVAIKALAKEESDTTVLLAQKEALRHRIIEMSQNRDAGEPESVSDIYAENDDYYYVSRS